MTDHDNTDHTLTFDIFGNIAVSGSLIPGLSYVIYASMTNYKGEQERSRAQKIVTISQDASQNIGNILLYPTGIYFKVDGQSYYYHTDLKQTHEKFLTEKTGFTLTARNTNDFRTPDPICRYIIIISINTMHCFNIFKIVYQCVNLI